MIFSDLQRRHRVVARHHLSGTADGAGTMVASVAIQHSTDPTTPFLAARARIPGFQPEQLEEDLYTRRTLLRMHTVRRTLFLVNAERIPHHLATAGSAILPRERARLVEWMGVSMEPDTIERMLTRGTEGALEALKGSELDTRALGKRVPELGAKVQLGTGKWVVEQSLGSRLLFLMALEGLIVRTRPAGTWRSSQYRWARADEWLGHPIPAIDELEARVSILTDYLATHGPVTMKDIRWWTGWTVARVKEALGQIPVQTVDLQNGEGLVLTGDTGPDPTPGVSVAFLPSLDSTIMGWKDRDWYLGGHGAELFDTNGNAGPTVWVDGRVVGGWSQTPDGAVVYELLEAVDRARAGLVADEAASLTGWLDGVVVAPRFPSPVGRRLAAG